MFDIVTAGHFSLDSIFLPTLEKPCVVLGSSVAYVSITASRLGARVSVISMVGDDFPKAYQWWLNQEGIDLSNVVQVKGKQTTRFELTYSDDLSSRVLRSENRLPPITVECILHPQKSRAVHLGPIADEISYDVAEKLSDCAEIVSLDPQGLVRRFDETGSVSSGSIADKRILELADICKSSLGELQIMTGLSELRSAVKAVHDYGVSIVIVTLGENGAVVSIEGTIYNVPTFKPAQIVDPTGAGDAFIGGFLGEYVQGKDCSWCSCVGAAAASFVVEAVGPLHLGEKEEIYQRAQVLYEKGIKQ